MMTNNLCCVLDTQWKCSKCSWVICNEHWVGDSACNIHKKFSPNCIISIKGYTIDKIDGGSYIFMARVNGD